MFCRQQVISQLAVERSRLESIESKISCMAMTCSSSGAGGMLGGDGGGGGGGGGGALLLSDPGSFSSPHDNDKEAEDSGSDDNNCELEVLFFVCVICFLDSDPRLIDLQDAFKNAYI